MLGFAPLGQLVIGQPNDDGQPAPVTPEPGFVSVEVSLTATVNVYWQDDNGQIAQVTWE